MSQIAHDEAVTSIGAPAYQRPAEEVVSDLNTDARRGLGGEEVRTRLERFGANELLSEPGVPGWRKFLAQFQDVLVILLLVATAISAGLWLYERDAALPYEAIAICAIVLLNAVMGYVQEARAESAVAALASDGGGARARHSRRRADTASPRRRWCPATSLIVEEGDTVPADARVIESTALQTAEAALTGESLPVSKDAAPIDWRGRPRRPRQHDLQRHGGDLRPRPGGGRRRRACGPRWGASPGCCKTRRDETTPLQKELDRVGKLLGRRRGRHRRRDDRDDHPRRARARASRRSSTCSSSAWRWPSRRCRRACRRS